MCIRDSLSGVAAHGRRGTRVRGAGEVGQSRIRRTVKSRWTTCLLLAAVVTVWEMCIRDRTNTVYANIVFLSVSSSPRLFAARAVGLSLIHIFIKRSQFRIHVGRQRSWIQKSHPISPPKPVSYTHLDVYKRQYWNDTRRSTEYTADASSI